MFGSIILDTAVGAALVYFFLSLIDTAVTDFIAGILNLRAKNLEAGIKRLLNDDGKPGGPADELYKSPLIKSISTDNKPSYIDPGAFAMALKDVVFKSSQNAASRSVTDLRNHLRSPDAAVNKELKNNFVMLLGEVGEDHKAVQRNIEAWFNASMERVTAWYKKQAQLIAFAVALVMAIALNVDSIHLVRTLYRDSNLRAGLVAAAENIAKQPSTAQAVPQAGAGGTLISSGTTTVIAQINNELEKIQFPIGWTLAPGEKAGTPYWKSKKEFFFAFIGWLITAIAASLGAPFWYDQLNKFIRLSGAKPAEGGK